MTLLVRLLFLSFCLPAQVYSLGGAGGGKLEYETIEVPAGEMALSVPLNTYLNIDYLDIPVKIAKPFRIGKHEVTRALWQQCHLAGGCSKPGLSKEGAGPEHPMVEINWHEAMQFARWYSKITGQRWRLPTDHEWFYVFSMGKGYRAEEKTFDYTDIEKIREAPKLTYPIGKFGANAWGVADLLGNVWEWTLGCHTLAPDRLLRPIDVKALSKPTCCYTRLVGGEHRAEVPDFVADTYQGGCSTLKPAANLGLRLVLEP